MAIVAYSSSTTTFIDPIRKEEPSNSETVSQQVPCKLEGEDPFEEISGVRGVSSTDSLIISSGPQNLEKILNVVDRCGPLAKAEVVQEITKKVTEQLSSDPLMGHLIPVTLVAGYFLGAIPAITGSVGYFGIKVWQVRNAVTQHVAQKTALPIINQLTQDAEKLQRDGIIPTTVSQATKNYRKLQLKHHPDKQIDKDSSTIKSNELTAAYENFKYLTQKGYHIT